MSKKLLLPHLNCRENVGEQQGIYPFCWYEVLEIHACSVTDIPYHFPVIGMISKFPTGWCDGMGKYRYSG